LAELRHAALPILTGWAMASPLGDGDRNPNTSVPKLNSHRDVNLLVDHDMSGKEVVLDYAYETTATVTDENGVQTVVQYWALASGGTVKDADGNPIAHPTLEQLLASPHQHGGWTVLEGEMIGFVERYIGEKLDIDSIRPEGTGDLSATIPL